MRKTPYRPGNDITQAFQDGICTVYAVTDQAEPGHRPVPRYTPRGSFHYAERRMGLARNYQARQAMVEVERVIRVPKPPPALAPSPQDIARTEDGRRYRIDMVQEVPGVFPASLDLTLAKTEPVWDTDAGADSGGGPGEEAAP